MKKLLSILIVVTLISSSCIIAFAQNNNNEDPFLKLDNALIEKLEQSNDDDIINVWVWFKDVEEDVFENAKTKAKESSGFDEESYSYALTEYEKDVFEKTQSIDDETQADSFDNALESYSKRTALNREKYNKKYREYQSAFRNEMSDVFSEKNTKIKNELGIADSEVQFISKLSSSAIFQIQKSKIFELADVDEVQYINYYEEDYDCPEPYSYDSHISHMQIDTVKDCFSASGNGVNVLINNTGLIWENNSEYNSIPEQSNIYNIITIDGETDIHYPDENLQIGATGHSMVVAPILKEVASDISIYCTLKSRYHDIEWSVINNYIDVINASVSYGFKTSYNNNPNAKWFDYISSNYNIPLVASAGNDIVWAGTQNFPYVISPASGCNSIAVGSFHFNNTLQDYKMSPFCYAYNEDGNGLVHYKPDIVIDSPHTSGAAPLLTATISLIFEKFPSLKGKPELIKAIVMASCHRKARPANSDEPQEYMAEGLTTKQGAGMFNAYTAMCIAALGNYGVKNYNDNQNEFSISPYSNSNINVSLVWFRNNIVPNNYNCYNNTIPSVVVADLTELELNVYNGNNLVAYSNKKEAYKQLAYFSANKNTFYNVNITKTSIDNTNVEYAYAWSSSATKYMDDVQIYGNKVAIGQPLTAKAYYFDDIEVSPDELNYCWQRSFNQVSWSDISNSNTQTYVISNNDQSNYIRCIVTPKATLLSDYIQLNDSSNCIVIRYGDINNDSSVDTLDIIKIQKYLSEEITLTNDQIRAGDVDGDGYVTILDKTYISRYISESIDSFPIETN